MSDLLCTVKPGKNVARLVEATNAVSMDEPCFGLSEVYLQSPGSKGLRRYQVLAVARNSKVVSFMRDLGPAAKFKAQQFRVPGGVMDEATGRFEIVHTVGELYDIADFLRAGVCPEPEFPKSDLFADALLQQEEARRCEKRASAFSQSAKIQRS